ncbi:protein sip5 [Aspergillus nomiae NRRL 13137]|uniref:Protein SIP5 n=1 Tax=Aspergillus nomiae NRRL (strain ATCC 15546 / NRRL 13137 / CBS 260.88 / M93) TaxID=1509407 RepID=A0A0L1IUC9_ASPN3|nr:protein sip5 [Aspergillus nomiae NRRL 13137]KNG83084.1 protein sip5 [Aspergillus nomiae NRRL 13137]
MGNSQTREARPPFPPNRRSHGGGHGRSPYGDRHHSEGSRSTRGSRPDLSILGIGGSSERDVATLEHRRETKQEREARRLERERVARVKERERSMREEHVDGGYLVTQGVYTGTEDFSKAMVRQLMIERRLAPFWRGLNDFSDSWTEHQLMAAARGLPIPPPDEIPPELEYKNPPKVTEGAKESTDTKGIQHLTVPITSRSQSYGSDASQSSTPAHSLPSPTSPLTSGTSSSPLFRTRAKTLASLTTSKHGTQADPAPREMQLPRDPFVNGQPIEAYLYKDAAECPICFLYYPPYLNRTRCCDQPICSECFVQIKRPDPHPPEHGDSDPNAPAAAAEGDTADSQDCQLVSEPAACPFCVQPEFGVTYAPPPFRRGLTYALDPSVRPNFTSPVSSTSSLSSGNVTAVTGRRRATSLSANDPTVITTDKVRPDWAQKLANARAHAARRSAAATALHTAAYLMNSNGNGSDSRTFNIGRRGVMRRAGGSDPHSSSSRTGSPALQALAFLTDRRAATNETDSAEEGSGNIAPPRNSSRRNRIDDLEEMMMMEAIRLSLASEEERRKREEKEAKKEAKKREKEAKKAEKSARKTGLYSVNASGSALDVPTGLGRVASSSSSAIGEESTPAGKGKEVDRVSPDAPIDTTSISSGTASASMNAVYPPANLADQHQSMQSSVPQSSPRELSKPSHLRHVSSASSSFSSLVESMSGDHTGTTEGNGSSTEPLFNFRSLAAVIGDEDKRDESAEHVENTSSNPQAEGSASRSVLPGNNTHTDDSVSKADAAASAGSEFMLQESQGYLIPKELETRSVEITDSTGNPQATS